jgi:hypothetical protein
MFCLGKACIKSEFRRIPESGGGVGVILFYSIDCENNYKVAGTIAVGMCAPLCPLFVEDPAGHGDTAFEGIWCFDRVV